MLSDIFANSRTRKTSKESGSKGIVLQAHPLDMTAPNRRPSVGTAPTAAKSLSEVAAELRPPSLPEPSEVKMPEAKGPSLNSLFDEIIEDEPRFARHLENL